MHFVDRHTGLGQTDHDGGAPIAQAGLSWPSSCFVRSFLRISRAFFASISRRSLRRRWSLSGGIHLSLFRGTEIVGIFSLPGGITQSLFCGTGILGTFSLSGGSTGILGTFLHSAVLLGGCRQGGLLLLLLLLEARCCQGGIVEAPCESGRARFLA